MALQRSVLVPALCEPDQVWGCVVAPVDFGSCPLSFRVGDFLIFESSIPAASILAETDELVRAVTLSRINQSKLVMVSK